MCRLATSEIFTKEGALEYEIRGVTHSGVDFSKVTGDELHAFTDHLTEELINNPVKSKVREVSELASKSAKDAIGSAKSGISKVGKATSKAWNQERDFHNIIFYGTGKPRNVALVIGACLSIAGVCSKLTYDRLTGPSFYDSEHSLPAASAVNPNSNSFHDVQVVSDAELKKLVGADTISSLDEIKTKKAKPVSTFEEQVINAARVGDVFEAQIPEDGRCNLVQTFNIPKGTVQMVESNGAPRLIVRVQKVTGFLEDTAKRGIVRVDESSSDTRTAELVQAQVCNPRDAKAVDFKVADGEHAFLQFVEKAPTILEGR